MRLRNIAAGLLISAVCLYFVLRNVDWGEVWAHLADINLPVFLVAMLLMLLAYFLMTWRWQHLLNPLDLSDALQDPNPPAEQADASDIEKSNPKSKIENPKSVGISRLYGMMMTGYFFNTFFPARAGDLVRAYLLGRRTGLRKTTVLATVVIEKAFDGTALLLMLLLSLVLLPRAVGATDKLGFDPSTLAWIAGIALVAVIVGLVLFYMHNARIAALVERVLGVLPIPDRLKRIAVRLVETFAGGMHVFKNPRPLVSSASISIAVWIVVALMFKVALESFNNTNGAQFPPELVAPIGVLFITAIVNLGLLIPALPGNFGTYEALCVAVMAFFGVKKELAVAFALVFHVGQLVTTLIVGLFAFWAQNMTLAEIRPVEEKAEQEAESALSDPVL
jgi:uncharacterized protein (TIRG00374 family)